MSKVLVLGDLITDKYRMCTATRLCPEGPVPVLIENVISSSVGGAGLVVAQLRELLGSKNVACCYGSESEKERIFADDRLMLRLDRDSFWRLASHNYLESIEAGLDNYPDAIIISDYNKGSFDKELSEWLVRRASDMNIPVFVDAKNNSGWYDGVFAIFPNEHESASLNIKHIIRKRGAHGCNVDGTDIETISHAVRDTTGAGDIFMAAFVYHWLEGLKIKVGNLEVDPFFLPSTEETVRLNLAAKFANKVAGISVEYVGTHVVTQEEIETCGL